MNTRAQTITSPDSGEPRAFSRWASTVWWRWSATERFDPPPRGAWPAGLRRLRAIGLAVLAIELLVFCWWGSLMVSRFSLTTDFAAYYQPSYLIAHGHLNPYSTLWNFSFWRNDGEFVFWLLAIPVRIWTHFETLKWMQALALVAGQAIAFGWVCDIAADWLAGGRVGRTRTRQVGTRRGTLETQGGTRTRSETRTQDETGTHRTRTQSRNRSAPERRSTDAIALVAVGLVMLIANPWFIWSLSFDVHSEVFAVPFVIATARDSYRGRTTRAWLWAALALGCGAVSASYIAAVGLSLVISGRRWWRQGLALAVAGLVWQMVLRGIGATGGSNVVSLYWQYFITKQHTLPQHGSLPDLVLAIVRHPSTAITTIWGNRTNIWATISPSGAIGVLWLPALVPSVLVLAEGALVRYIGFALPSFQNIVIAPLIVVGTVVFGLKLFARLRGTRHWVGMVVVGVLAVNSLMWGVVWFPQVAKNWLLVPKSSAHALAQVRREIGPDDQVIVSQGTAGGFADRKYIYNVLTNTATFPIKARRVWFVFTPAIGIETAQVGQTSAVIDRLTRLPGMRLVVSRAGVWALRWNVPSGVTQLSISPTATKTITGASGAGLQHSSSSQRSSSSATGSAANQPNTQASSGAVVGSRAWLAALALADVVPSAYSIPAWTVAGGGGAVVRSGTTSDWYVINNGRRGFVVEGASWLEPPGHYSLVVSLDAAATTRIEVWDVNTGRLIRLRTVTGTKGRRVERFTLDLTKLTPHQIYRGWGIWQMLPVPSPRGDTIEVRISTTGRAGRVKVFGLSLR